MIASFVRWFVYGPFRRLCHAIFIKKINGIGNLPESGGFILAANHTSYMDIVALTSALMYAKKKDVKYLAKKELASNPLSRWIFNIGRQITFDRKLAGEKVLQEAVNKLKNNEVIGIFPEGTRSLTGKIQKGKTGVARLAIWSKAPVVPVGIRGTFRLMPKGKIIPKFKKNIIVNIGRPMHFDEYYNKKITNELLRRITDKVMKNIEKLSSKG